PAGWPLAPREPPPVRKPLSSSKYSCVQMPWKARISPPAWITMTWSVSSTKAIFIVPSGTSSSARRSTRRVTRGRLRRASRRGGVGLEAGGPLVLEQLPKGRARGGEGNAGHDGLQEAEDDELACLVGRDAPALEVEQLG